MEERQSNEDCGFSVTADIPLYLGDQNRYREQVGEGAVLYSLVVQKCMTFCLSPSLAYLLTKVSACCAAGKLSSLKFQQEQNENCQSLSQIRPS